MALPQEIPDIENQSQGHPQPRDHVAEQHAQDAAPRDESHAMHEACRQARDLKAMVEHGSFRRDLYYRLALFRFICRPNWLAMW
jgi:hypothetical protein